MFDLSPCRLGSLTDLGHCAYAIRTCPQCAGAYFICEQCPPMGELCPGCRHRAVLTQIAAGKVVFPAVLQVSRPGEPATAVGGGRADLDDDQAGAVGELAHDTDQAAMLDAGREAVYAPSVENPNSPDSPALGATPVDTHTAPLILLLLPVDLAGVPPVLQALAAVIAPQGRNGPTNGHGAADPGSQPRIPRKTFLSDRQCPHGHTYQNTGKALRYHGNNQCVPCSGQRKPRRQAASTAANTEG